MIPRLPRGRRFETSASCINLLELTRDTCYEHLNAIVPDELKYGLHLLLIAHGKTTCKAKGCMADKCPICGSKKGKEKESKNEAKQQFSFDEDDSIRAEADQSVIKQEVTVKEEL